MKVLRSLFQICLLAGMSAILWACETVPAEEPPESTTSIVGESTPERMKLAKERGFFFEDAQIAGYCMHVGFELEFKGISVESDELWRAELARISGDDSFKIRAGSAEGGKILHNGTIGLRNGGIQYTLEQLQNIALQCEAVLTNGYPAKYPVLVGELFPLEMGRE